LVYVSLFFENSGEAEGSKSISLSFVELVLELDPMQSECVKEGLHQIHAHKHSECDTEEQEE